MIQVNSFQYKLSSNNWLRGAALFSFIFLIFLSPIVNLVDVVGTSIPFFYYPVLLIFGIIAAFPAKSYYIHAWLVIVIFILVSIAQSPVKAIGAALVFHVAYIGVRDSELIVLRACFTLLIVNYLIMLLQISGIYENAFILSNYSNDATHLSSLEYDSISAHFLPQIRPSGIFPAPTYVSYFCLVLYSLSSLFSNIIDKWFMALIGSFFVITGSTIGLVLIFFLAMDVFRNRVIIWAILGYAFSLFIYFALVPELAAYNYSLVDIFNSLLYRRMDESILTLNLILFTFIVSGFLLIYYYFMAKYSSALYKFLPIVVLIFFPLLLHDSSSSLLSFFMMGLGVGIASSLKKRPT